MLTGRPAGTVLVTGSGALATEVRAALRRSLPPPGGQRTAALALQVAVGIDLADSDVNHRAARHGPPVLAVRVVADAVEIGPLVVPGEPGCLECVRRRADGARRAGTATARKIASARDELRWSGLPSWVLAGVGALVADEVGTLGLPGTDRSAVADPPRSRQTVLRVATASLRTSRHRFLPVAACQTCGGLPEDTATAAVFPTRPNLKADPDGFRLGPINGAELLDRFVDERTGVVAGVELHLGGETPVSAARVSPVCEAETVGYGRTVDRTTSVTVSILEGLERRAGLQPGGKRTVTRSSYADLAPGTAVDPVSLGLPTWSPSGRSGYVDYTPDLRMNWVYGYSFGRRAPVLLPESYAYYGVHGGRRFAFECSNGCALGGSLAEAVLHGIFEIAERDAFLATWYARLPAPRVDPGTATDLTVRLLVDRMERAGLAVHVFDTTMPEGVPAWWVMLVNEDGHPEHPMVYCGAGAGLDPEGALRSALFEAVNGIGFMRRQLHTPEAVERAHAMLADPDLVEAMEDHALLYALPEAWPRFGFLYRDAELHSVAEAFPPAQRYVPSPDLTDDLHHLVDRYLRSGLDVVAVDTTPPELRAAGLYAAKVVIPGTFPMTFGHRHRRAEMLPRLRTAPVRLGHRTEPLPDEEVNPHPHPFP
ncbi:TOMM precursor leader peptide-binding protein [Micromonospora sp. WMMD1102]|uniref:TOMM precursor leader peptide-binding protein n=1 Tax=Micromonospora sp. WMMD1102 TaxID=3016105 RepID=UPI00241555BB|nr:TOMM precursor leader peptide-binding protein [Micromonospora sp. WMMD1102]MDG4788203.1 TOMM precursor leader peptide-binding protein [Micromonospora sp. WMMD1102]